MDCFCTSPREIHCRIVFLDDHELNHEIQDDNSGQVLLDVVLQHLNLMETAYFGLRYVDDLNQTHWLDPVKKLGKQLNWNCQIYTLYFGVKFYAVDPCKLIEEITRYQFFLQIKQDIYRGRLPVPFELAAELGAYIIQSELGDYDPKRHISEYVSEFRFLSNQTAELETRVAEYHKTLVGLLPSTAELNYLDKVKWLELYGVDLHSVLGEDSVEYFLGLTPSGIVVLRNKNIVGNYYWPRMTKIYFKSRYFMLRVADKNNGESTYGFETPSKAACKHLWKCCIEHHAFFRLYQVSPATGADIFGLGSRFRFSGRTEKQAVQDAKKCVRNPPVFFRTPSRRRIVDGTSSSVVEEKNTENNYSQEKKMISIPQPVQLSESPYRSLNNVTIGQQDLQEKDSPLSSRSVPWSQPHSRGLYGSGNNTGPSGSPHSGHSTLHHRSYNLRQRSSSVDSQSSSDSRVCKRHRHHRSRCPSDNESEHSKCSGLSHRKHRRSYGNRHAHDSGSEPDSSYEKSKRRHRGSHYKLVDSESQWKEVQRQQALGSSIQQASIVSSRQSGHVNSGHETESEISYRNCTRRHRKHRSRSRSRSPSEAKMWLPDELKKHLEFDLIDTAGMNESQLKEIRYTVVQTNQAKQTKLKHLNAYKKGLPASGTNKKYPLNELQSASTSNGTRSNSWAVYGNSNSVMPDLMDNANGNHIDPLEHGISHEHTDSGLGAEQDYDYSGDRLNGQGVKSLGCEARNCNPVSKTNNTLNILYPTLTPGPLPIQLVHRSLPRSNKQSFFMSQTDLLDSNSTGRTSVPAYSNVAYSHPQALTFHNNCSVNYSTCQNIAGQSNRNRIASRLNTSVDNNEIISSSSLAYGCYASLGRAFIQRDGPLRLRYTSSTNGQNLTPPYCVAAVAGAGKANFIRFTDEHLNEFNSLRDSSSTGPSTSNSNGYEQGKNNIDLSTEATPRSNQQGKPEDKGSEMSTEL